jgi:hypothetical protein
MIEELIEELNSVIVTKEELRLVVAKTGTLRAQGIDEDGVTVSLFKNRQPENAIAIYSRLRALAGC